MRRWRREKPINVNENNKKSALTSLTKLELPKLTASCKPVNGSKPHQSKPMLTVKHQPVRVLIYKQERTGLLKPEYPIVKCLQANSLIKSPTPTQLVKRPKHYQNNHIIEHQPVKVPNAQERTGLSQLEYPIKRHLQINSIVKFYTLRHSLDFSNWELKCPHTDLVPNYSYTPNNVPPHTSKLLETDPT